MTQALLLVEDNPVDARFLEGLLQRRTGGAYVVTRGSSLSEVEQLVQSGGRPEMVVLDLSLPDSQGLATLHAVQRAVGDVPIVILSGYDDESMAKEAVASGAQDYLVKGGIDSARLVRSLQYAFERHRLDKMRRELDEQATMGRRLEAVGQLAAGIAHEINTPIQYVIDNCHFLDDSLRDVLELLQALAASPDGLDATRLAALLEKADAEYIAEQVPRAISQSLEGLRHIARIVQAMREFSHPPVEQKVPFALNHTVEVSTLVTSNEWKGVAKLELDLAPDLPELAGYPGEMNQALLNLIVNAAHAVGERMEQDPERKVGLIRIATAHVGEAIELSIEDTGSGMTPEVQKRIFEPFFTTKDIGRGTGQGLPFIYNVIVKKHGGTIDVESEPGRGTTFRLRLPLG